MAERLNQSINVRQGVKEDFDKLCKELEEVVGIEITPSPAVDLMIKKTREGLGDTQNIKEEAQKCILDHKKALFERKK
jgi:hypothetical protein